VSPPAGDHGNTGGTVFRAAVLEDARRIAELNNSHLGLGHASGFLITRVSVEMVRELIEAPTCSLTVALDPLGEVTGFLHLSDTVGEDVLSVLEWSEVSWRGVLEHRKSCYIEKVAVDRGRIRKGLGTELYRHAFRSCPDTVFYAFVVRRPSCNEASICFHERLGFVEAARYRTREFHGLQNYESVMFVRWADPR
jgi:GNAT superfamily N-acetyltransferase